MTDLICRASCARAYRLGASLGLGQYFERNLYLTGNAAAYSVEVGASFVGIDSYNIDDTENSSRPAHSQLLHANIPICEHVRNLESLPDSVFQVHAVPTKVKECRSCPVRAYAVLGL